MGGHDTSAQATTRARVVMAGSEWYVFESIKHESQTITFKNESNTGTWNPYNDLVIETIEEALKAGKSTVDIQSAGRTYRINMSGKTQTNLTTGGSRVIRRTMELFSKRDWCCQSCGYRMTDAKSKICTNCNHKRAKRRRRF